MNDFKYSCQIRQKFGLAEHLLQSYESNTATVFKIEGCLAIKITDSIHSGKKIGTLCIVVKSDEPSHRHFTAFNIAEESVYKLL